MPNLEREHTSLPTSTVVLTQQRVTRADALFSVQQKISSEVANPLVFDGQKLVPSVGRTYSASRPLFVFLQAYERDLTPEQVMRPLVAFVSFYRDGVKMFETEPMGVDEWDSKLRAVPIRITIPPGALQPGRYDCQVTVLDSRGNKAAFWRAPIVLARQANGGQHGTNAKGVGDKPPVVNRFSVDNSPVTLTSVKR